MVIDHKKSTCGNKNKTNNDSMCVSEPCKNVYGSAQIVQTLIEDLNLSAFPNSQGQVQPDYQPSYELNYSIDIDIMGEKIINSTFTISDSDIEVSPQVQCTTPFSGLPSSSLDCIPIPIYGGTQTQADFFDSDKKEIILKVMEEIKERTESQFGEENLISDRFTISDGNESLVQYKDGTSKKIIIVTNDCDSCETIPL